uniref:Uncharacterized protein n=1 Tax=Salix viminalis TaxID=40686 RepID=A0A6N2LRD8_SALVM
MGGSAENKKGSLFSLPRLKPRLHGRRKSLLSKGDVGLALGGLLNKTRLFSFAVWQLAKLQEEDSGNNDFSYAAYRIWPIAALKGWLSFVSEAECLCFTFSTKSISKRHVPFRMTLVRHFDPGADKDFDGLEGFEPEGSMGYYSEELLPRHVGITMMIDEELIHAIAVVNGAEGLNLLQKKLKQMGILDNIGSGIFIPDPWFEEVKAFVRSGVFGPCNLKNSWDLWKEILKDLPSYIECREKVDDAYIDQKLAHASSAVTDRFMNVQETHGGSNLIAAFSVFFLQSILIKPIPGRIDIVTAEEHAKKIIVQFRRTHFPKDASKLSLSFTAPAIEVNIHFQEIKRGTFALVNRLLETSS